MINLRVGLALCKLLEIDPDLVTDISLETHTNGPCFLSLKRRISEEEMKRIEDILKSHKTGECIDWTR